MQFRTTLKKPGKIWGEVPVAKGEFIYNPHNSGTSTLYKNEIKRMLGAF
jgi:hypothetical protein